MNATSCRPGALPTMAVTSYSMYTTQTGELHVEIAVPGRESEDIDIQIREDKVVVLIASKESAPGSLLNHSFPLEIENISDRWNLDGIQATCRSGLLSLVFPARPRTREKLSDWKDFILKQAPGLN